MPEGALVADGGRTLTMTATSLRHGGLYACSATNVVGSATQHCFVTVQSAAGLMFHLNIS